MAELIAVLGILAILAAAAVPSAISYIRQGRFRQYQENAKTLYLGVESVLTYYRASGQWEEFRRELELYGTKSGVFTVPKPTSAPMSAVPNDRIYGIVLVGARQPAGEGIYSRGELEEALKATPGTTGYDQEKYKKAKQQALVYQLLNESAGIRDYGGGLLDGGIVIEIDSKAGKVYSAFCADADAVLAYEGGSVKVNGDELAKASPAPAGKGDMWSYAGMKAAGVGYYSVNEVTNVVKFETIMLQVTDMELINGERLLLTWTGDSRNKNPDMYELTLYKGEALLHENLVIKKGDHDYKENRELFHTLINVEKDFVCEKIENGKKTGYFALKLYNKEKVFQGTYYFLGEIEGRKITLVLDAMMSAELRNKVEKDSESEDSKPWLNTSITRLKKVDPDFDKNIPIYAQVISKATKVGDPMIRDEREYCDSIPVRSKSDALLLGLGGLEKGKVVVDSGNGYEFSDGWIKNFRHLSNVYYMKKEVALKGNLDWNDGMLYDLDGEGKDAKLVLKEVAKAKTKGEKLAFPSIPSLNVMVHGEGNKIHNLYLSDESVCVSSSSPSPILLAETLDLSPSPSPEPLLYLGLFQTISESGGVNNIIFASSAVEVTGEHNFAGVGMVAGKSSGEVAGITIGVKNESCSYSVTEVAGRPTSGAYGGIVGENAAVVKGCTNDSDMSVAYYAGGSAVGGIVGKNLWYAEGCYNNKSVNAIAVWEKHGSNVNGNVGGIAGENSAGGNILGCTNSGNVDAYAVRSDGEAIDATGVAGGIVGVNSGNVGERGGCTNMGSVLGDVVAGIAAFNKADGEIQNCVNQGKVGGGGTAKAGGIVAINQSDTRDGESILGRIQDCSNGGVAEEGFVDGIVNGKSAGGIVVENLGSISSCKNIGTVTGEKEAGGIAVINGDRGEISSCYNGDSDRWEEDGWMNLKDGKVKSGEGRAAGIAVVNDGTIGGSDNFNGVVEGNQAGGIVVENTGSVKECNSGDSKHDDDVINLGSKVNGVTSAAGIVVYNKNEILSCKNMIAVKAANGSAGGIVANNDSGASLKGCTNNGAVTATNGSAGGVVANNSGMCSGCANRGNVTASGGEDVSAGSICAKPTLDNTVAEGASVNVIINGYYYVKDGSVLPSCELVSTPEPSPAATE